MKRVLIALAVVALTSTADVIAQQKTEDDRQREAKALLLLSEKKCAPSLEKGWEAAAKTGKPLVVMVGNTTAGCETASAAGGVGVKVYSLPYGTGSGKAGDPRVVILSPGSGGTTDPDRSLLYVRQILNATTGKEAVEEAVKKYKPPPPPAPTPQKRSEAPVNTIRWEVQAPPADAGATCVT